MFVRINYKICMSLFISIVCFLVGLILGLLLKNSYIKSTLINSELAKSYTFYASIEKIIYNDNNIIFVKGLDTNDPNYRGTFYFNIKDTTIIINNGKNANISDLNIGNKIQITFNDEIIDAISPTPINNVQVIRILNYNM